MVIKFTILLLAIAAAALGDGTGRLLSKHAKADFALTADPTAKPWKNVKGVIAENGPTGKPAPGHRTEIRSRWTSQNLYLLFVCPYEELHVNANPDVVNETNVLWNHDVAEAFIGTDLKNIKHYYELQVSPQGEWVDLDIHRETQPPTHDEKWNSGYKVKARLDKDKKVWYGEFQIPLAAIGIAKPAKGTEMRANFYRLQGPPERQVMVAWQPTGAPNYHIPEAFGRLVLE